MEIDKLNLYLSEHRLNRYLIAVSYDFGKSVQLYKANLLIARSFHPILGYFEVVLRNTINSKLSSHFEDTEWILNQRALFMSDNSLTHRNKKTSRLVRNDFLFKSVKKAEKRISSMGATVTSGKIIAEQTLGFWTSLFEVHHYRLLKGCPIQIFTNLPYGVGRKEVLSKLNEIRILRNRINHNEPICFNGNSVDFSQIESVYSSILDLLQWIDGDLCFWIKDLDVVKSEISSAKSIL